MHETTPAPETLGRTKRRDPLLCRVAVTSCLLRHLRETRPHLASKLTRVSLGLVQEFEQRLLVKLHRDAAEAGRGIPLDEDQSAVFSAEPWLINRTHVRAVIRELTEYTRFPYRYLSICDAFVRQMIEAYIACAPSVGHTLTATTARWGRKPRTRRRKGGILEKMKTARRRLKPRKDGLQSTAVDDVVVSHSAMQAGVLEPQAEEV